MTVSDDTFDEQIARIEIRAKQRYRRRLPLLLLVAVPAGVVVGVVLGRSDHHPRHHHSILGFVIGLVVAVVVLGAGWWVLRRRGSWQERFRPSLLLGLDRPDRKRAVRGLRRGRPDDDPLLREVQLRSARRIVQQSRYNRWVFSALIVLQVLIAIGNAVRGELWVPNALCAVLLAALWPWTSLLLRRARALLAAVDSSPR